MICRHCGYAGERAPCAICNGNGKASRACAYNYCPECGGYLVRAPIFDVQMLKAFLIVAFVVAVGLLLCFLVTGCGAPFTADYFSTAGAGGYTQTMSQAGAGGREVVPNGDAGQGANAAGAAGASGSRGGNELAGGGGKDGAPPAGAGGRGMDTGGTSPSSGGNAGASAACLTDWEGSSCDTCTSQASSEGARSCLQVLDCYLTNHCTPATCAGLCDYSEPTTDAAVKAARAVFECRCAQ